MVSERPAIDWHWYARYLHEAIAVIAVLWLALLFLDHWDRNEVMPYPVAAFAIAVILLAGGTLARASVRSMSRVVADDDVAELLNVAYPSLSDPPYQPASLQRWLPLVMPVQIVATAIIGLYLIVSIVSIQTGAPPAEPPAKAAPAAASASTEASAKPASSPERQTWPAIAAIALSELAYLGWIFEGEAAAQELVALSRRWARRRAASAPHATDNVKTEGDAPKAVPETSPAPSPLPGPARRAREICKLLARYGVDLVPQDAR
jgi:hypothetical protein